MAHLFPVQVRFNELDPYSHLNHAVYLTYCETARIDLLDDIGWSMGRLEEEGYHILVVEFTARYLRAAELLDELTVETEVVEVKRSSSLWRQQVVRADEAMFRMDLRGAIVDLEGTPRRMPAGLSEALQKYAVEA